MQAAADAGAVEALVAAVVGAARAAPVEVAGAGDRSSVRRTRRATA